MSAPAVADQEREEPMPIQFEFNPDKFVSAAAYITQRAPDMTKTKLFKLLYFADKRHLSVYGRPILGDVYIKMDNGPVPSAAYDIIKLKRDKDLLARHLHVRGMRLILNGTPDMDSLSDSDIEVLDEVLRTYGRKSAEELSDLSHLERAWIEAPENGVMDYRLFLDGDEESDELLELIRDDQEVRLLLSDGCIR
jgi:uncharacterized phage-associated protein